MFCQNCGKKIEGGDLFCPFCGAKQQQVNPSENGGASFTAGSQKLTRKGLGIAVICVLIVIVLALVLIGSLCTGGPKQVVKEYYQAIEKCDAKKLLDTVPKDYLKEVMDEKDLTKRELLKEVQAYLDKYYSGYDDIKVSITDQEKLDQDDFSDYFDFDLEEDADLEIKKAVQFDLKVRYQSDEGKQTEKEEFIVFRYENGWYSMDAVFLVAMSALPLNRRNLMTILQTERLLLRPLAPTDFAAFRTFAADGELTKYMLFYPLEQEAELHTFLQNAAQAWNSLFPQTYEFAVLRKAELLGTVTLEYMTPEQGMLGWLFRADAHGKGYATEAAKAVVEWCREKLPYRTLVACCDARNAASERVMQRIGMHFSETGSRTYPQTGETAEERTYIMTL